MSDNHFNVELNHVESFSFLFKYLWSSLAANKLRVNIVDTVLMQNGTPFLWLFSSEQTGEVLRKKTERLSVSEIVRAFKQKAHNIYGLKNAKLKSKVAIVWYVQSDTKLSSYLVDERELSSVLVNRLTEVVAIQVYMGSYSLKGNGLFEHTFKIVDKRILHSTYENLDNSAYDNPNTFFTNNLNTEDHSKKLYIREQQHDIICLACNRLVTYLIANVQANIKSLTVQVIFDSNWNPYIVSAQKISLSHASEAFVSLRDTMIYAYGSKPLLPSFNQKSLLLPMNWSEHNTGSNGHNHPYNSSGNVASTGRPVSASALKSSPRKQQQPVSTTTNNSNNNVAAPLSLEEFSLSSAPAVEHLVEGKSHSPFGVGMGGSQSPVNTGNQSKGGSPFPLLKKQLKTEESESQVQQQPSQLSEVDEILLNTAIRTWSVGMEGSSGTAPQIDHSHQRSASAVVHGVTRASTSSGGADVSPSSGKHRSLSAAVMGSNSKTTGSAAINSANLSKSAIVNTKALFQLPSGTVNITHNDILTAKEIHKTSSKERIDVVKSNFSVNHNTRKANVASTVENSLAEKANERQQQQLAAAAGATGKTRSSVTAAAAASEPEAGEGKYFADVEYMYARFNNNQQHNSDLMINEFARILEPPPKEKKPASATRIRKSQSNKELASSRPQSAPSVRKTTTSSSELARLREGQQGILYQNTGLNHFSTHNSDNHLLSNYNNKQRHEKERIKKEKTEEFDRLSSTFNSAALEDSNIVEDNDDAEDLIDNKNGDDGVDAMFRFNDTYHSHLSAKLTQSSVLRNHDDVINSMTRRHINSSSQHNLTTIDRDKSSLLNVTESVHMRTTFYASQIKDQTNNLKAQERVFNKRRPISAPHTKEYSNPIDRHAHRPFAATSDEYGETNINCMVKVLPLSGASCFGDYCQFIQNRTEEQIHQEQLYEAMKQQSDDGDGFQPYDHVDPRHNFTNSLQKPPKVRSKECPHQLSYKSILLARAEEAFVEINLENDMQSLWDQIRLSNLTSEQVIGYFAKKHLSRVIAKCASQARVLSYNSSIAPINAWNDLNAAYRQLVYTDALTKIHPTRFYYTVPMCDTCFKLYSYLDAQREVTVLQPPIHGPPVSTSAPAVNRLPGYHKLRMSKAREVENNDEENEEDRQKSPPHSPTTRRASPPVDDVKDLAASLRPKQADTIFQRHDHHSVAARRSHSASSGKLRTSQSSNPLAASLESVTPLNRTNSHQFDTTSDRGIGAKGPLHKNVLSIGITTREGQVSSWVKLCKPEKVRPKKQYTLAEDERLTQEVGITTQSSAAGGGRGKSKSAAKLRTAVNQANNGNNEGDEGNQEEDRGVKADATENDRNIENAYNANEIMYYASNMPSAYAPLMNPYANPNFTAMESYYFQMQQMQQMQLLQQQNNAMLAMINQQQEQLNSESGVDYSIFAVNPYVSNMTPFPAHGNFTPGYVPMFDPNATFTPFTGGPYYPLSTEPPAFQLEQQPMPLGSEEEEAKTA